MGFSTLLLGLFFVLYRSIKHRLDLAHRLFLAVPKVAAKAVLTGLNRSMIADSSSSGGGQVCLWVQSLFLLISSLTKWMNLFVLPFACSFRARMMISALTMGVFG